MTEKLLNSSIKQPLGVSPNTIIFGNAFNMDTSLLGIIDQDISDSKPSSVRDYVDTLIERQSRLIDAAIQSQNETNDANLRRRYSHYPRRPKLRQQVLSGDENSVIETTEPIPVSHIVINPAPSRAPVISAVKWIRHKDPISGHEEYIKLVEPQKNVIDTIEEIDTNPYLLTTYNVNDYVLRRYPSSKIRGGYPHKYGSWWRGPYLIVSVIPKHVSDSFMKPRYTIRNLVTGKEYMVDVTYI
jgi:hypothetical protein